MKHAFVILFLLALGTAFLSIAYFSPEEDVVVVPTSSPSGGSFNPPTPLALSPSPKGSGKILPSVAATPSPAVSTAVKPSEKPSPTPSAVVSPSEKPSEISQEEAMLLATRPERILEEARIKSGRADPFISLVPVPVVPEPTIPPSKRQIISKVPRRMNYWVHIPPSLRPELPLDHGIALTGIIEASGEDPVAILEINGKESKVVKSGDILNNSINIVSINTNSKTITLGKGTKVKTVKMNQ